MINTNRLKEESQLVFNKITDGIYKIEKDRDEKFSGAVYVSTEGVIDALNNCLKVAIYQDWELVHVNFKVEILNLGDNRLAVRGAI